MWPCTKLKKLKTSQLVCYITRGNTKGGHQKFGLPRVSVLLSSNMVRRKLTQAPAGASPPSWVRQKLTPASAKAPPSRPSRAPLPPSPRKMTNHVAGAARANEEERERAKGRAFSTEEDDTLRKARGQPGWTWKEITSQLPGRSERATRDRWTRTLCEALQPRQLDRQQQPQTPKQRTVRFECDGCGKRLKAKVPTGVGRFRTKCSDCGKWLEKVPQDLQAHIATHLPHTPEYVTPPSS